MLPWLLTAGARDRLRRPVEQIGLGVILATVVVLAVCGANPIDQAVIPNVQSPLFIDADLNSYLWLSRAAAAYYFAYIFAMAPLRTLGARP